MKDFLKYMLAAIVGVCIVGVVFTIIGIMSVAGMVASSSGSETKVNDNSVFILNLSGSVEERSQPNPLSQLMGDDFGTYGLDDILSSIKKAKDNEKIKGICLNAGAFACSPASLEEIRNALVDFKESGKFIVAYGGNYLQNTYYLASVADKVAINPQGSLGWHGLATQTYFLKDLYDKIGIEMQVFRVGTYKSAVEPYIATQMSDANREQTQAFVNSIWGQMVADVAESRNIPADSLNALADRNMDLQPTETYIATGLADTLMYQDEMLAYLKQLTDTEEDDALNKLYLDDMVNVQRNVPKDKSGNILAVYYAAGTIGSSELPTDEGIDPGKVTKDLRKLREDESVKAVVLRVNSPGGSAFGSEEIWREVTLLKEKKPVIVSMGDYAASGGYYISCAADWIVAQPTTLTGSIGIFGRVPNAGKLLNDKLGIHFDGVKTNKLADLGDITRPFNEEEKALMQNMVNKGYELFTQRCADGRKMPIDEIKKIAEGRVWTGEMAKDLKLVDELGGIDRAIAVAAERAEIEDYTVMSYPKQEDFISSLMSSGTDRYLSARMKDELGVFYEPFRHLQNLKNSDPVQARLPFMITIK
ncbi:signal peptide peptidase SppA [Bacteroides gallinaceum]|uniref:signal peptide peptidase SppA n=1 Tax=Bacteroides gallinaceum TaxID=1462571 RepID=UPI0025A3294A|nr:signal peptide peptidase SppA [Bacteroides gallinaceum]MDM8153821.1 signal peptide peptidase SppA [Bacteroides gallinaceum]